MAGENVGLDLASQTGQENIADAITSLLSALGNISGVQGPKGDKGDKGDTGAKGDKGDTGNKGDQGVQGETGNGIVSIEKTSTAGSVDTYTITMTDGTTATFTVTNGSGAVDSVNNKTGNVELGIDDIPQLKNALDYTNGLFAPVYYGEISIPVEYEQGGITSTGYYNTTISSVMIRTPKNRQLFIPKGAILSISRNTGYNAQLFIYDTNKTFIERLSNATSYTASVDCYVAFNCGKDGWTSDILPTETPLVLYVEADVAHYAISNAKLIASASNLNDLIAPGVYISNSSVLTNSLLNTPMGLVGGFRLETSGLYNNTSIQQIIYSINDPKTIYRRYKISDTWYAWKEIGEYGYKSRISESGYTPDTIPIGFSVIYTNAGSGWPLPIDDVTYVEYTAVSSNVQLQKETNKYGTATRIKSNGVWSKWQCDTDVHITVNPSDNLWEMMGEYGKRRNGIHYVLDVLDGTHDLYTEMGGLAYYTEANSDEGSDIEYGFGPWAGWNPILENCDLIGHGNVLLTLNPTDDVTSLTKAIYNIAPVTMTSNSTIENINIDCSYCRYAIHSENGTSALLYNSRNVIRNCKLKYGEENRQIIGAGVSHGSELIIENVHFEKVHTSAIAIYGHGRNDCCGRIKINNVYMPSGYYAYWHCYPTARDIFDVYNTCMERFRLQNIDSEGAAFNNVVQAYFFGCNDMPIVYGNINEVAGMITKVFSRT